jgi:putative FmdB family regulatory protein
MPTYQYRCTECGEDLEAVQKFSDAPLSICPACGGQLRKVFNAVGVVFKGSGFYRTDSRNGSSHNGDRGDSGSSEKKSGTETKSSDKEPAGAGSASSTSSSNGKQQVSSGASSTGQKSAAS